MKKLLSVLLLSVMIIAATGCEGSFNVSTGDDDDEGQADLNSELSQTFNTDKFGYTMNYPEGWEKQEDATAYVLVVANGMASVAIQNLASVEMGGTYGSADDVVTEFKAQLEQAQDIQIEDGEDVLYTLEDGTQVTAKQFVAQYTIPEDNATYKQWQLVIPRPDGKVFHSWSYTSLVENYDAYLPAAQAMLETWAMI